MFNGKKIISGIAAVLIYFLLIYIVLLNYNRHEEKAKNYVDKNSNRVTVTLVNSDKTLINKSTKENNTKKPLPQSNLIPAVIPPIIPLKTPIKLKTPTKIKVKEPIKRVRPPKPNIKLRDRAKKEKERVRQVQIKKDKVAKERSRQAQIKKNKMVKERARQAQVKKDKANKERAKKARIKEAQVKKDKAVVKERARQAWIKKDKAAKERVKQAQIKKDKAVKKERARQAWIKKDKAAKKRAAKKERERLARIKKEKEATTRANEERERASRVKKDRAAKKERERLARIKEEREATKRAERARERERQARAKKERERRQAQRSQDLFSSVNTQQQRREPVRQQSRVHHTSAADRIKNSHQSGRTSTKNQDSGVKNAYIARVKRHLNNWSAQSNYAGHNATIKLTIRNNGKFRYVITRTSSGSLSSGLREFLAQLNRMGLGRHDKSSAYVITVHFKAN